MDIDVMKALGPTLRRIERLPDEERALAIGEVWRQITLLQGHLAKVRRGALRQMRLRLTIKEVAAALGMSSSRVKQITDDSLERPAKKAAVDDAVERAMPAKKAPAKKTPALTVLKGGKKGLRR